MDINVRSLNQSVASIRGQKEMSTIHSNNKMGKTSVGEIGSSGLPANMGLCSQNFQYAPGMTAGNVGGGVDGFCDFNLHRVMATA